jgi:glycosyltransferase involved in cell wall biosynthesis
MCSILLPFRDAETTLQQAVESIRVQTFQDWELLLLNDGSKDNGPHIAEKLAEQDPRIRVLHLPPQGIVSALTTGIELAQSPVLARMDADDVSHPDRIAKQVVYLRDHPTLDLISCRVGFGGDRKAQAGYASHVDWINNLITHEDMFFHRFVDAPIAHPSVMFRRSAVDHFGGYREGKFPEDFELWLRWFERRARFAKLPEMLLTWNDHPDRLSRCDPRYSQEAFYRTKCEYLLKALPEQRPLWLWGAGRPTRKRFAPIKAVRPFAGFVDIDPAKIGRHLQGRPVVFPDQIPEDAYVLLGVANPGAREKSASFLTSMGLQPEENFLPVA